MIFLFQYIFFVFFTGISLPATAQSGGASDSLFNPLRSVFSYQGSFHTGFIFAHSQEVQNTKGARPAGAEISLTWQRNDERIWNLCNCMPQQGVMLAYYNYDNAILGKGYISGYILEPWYTINRSNFFSFKTAAGLSYLTNPYHPQRNSANQSYSTTISVYLSAGAGWWHRFSDSWWTGTHIQYQHISNGGLRTPNKGINWPTGSLTVSYRPQPRELQTFTKSAWRNENKIRYDLGIFGVGKRVGGQQDGKSNRYLVAGSVFQITKEAGRINNLSVGAEFVWDEVVRSRMESEGLMRHPWQISILAGHEFVLGNFLFSQRLGVYLYEPADYFDLFFHRWGLAYRFNEHWSLGFDLKAHRQVADYTDLRLVYSFHK